MSSVVATPRVQFFIPGIVALRLGVEQLASGCRTTGSSTSRLSYRFTYRVSRGGPVYGCRIKTSKGTAESLIERVYALIDEAESEGDTAMLVGCAMALEAIEQHI